jgi:hypothetical protein
MTKGAKTMSDSNSARTTPLTEDADRPGDLARPVACLLLAGGLKASHLANATGVSPLDLHLTEDSTVLEAWLSHFEQMQADGSSSLDVRVIHGHATPPPSAPRQVSAKLRLIIERESGQYRGPAGAAKDACATYGGDSLVMIVEAARFLAADLRPVLAQHRARDADITVVCNADSSPAGIFLVRRSTLDLVPRIGFMDLKEQWLTRAVAGGHHVRVHRLPGNPSHELRTPGQFLLAARAAREWKAQLDSNRGTPAAAPQIAAGAVVVDSVVMPGAVVTERCVVVRSIVCAGARIAPGSTVIDEVVRGGGRASMAALHHPTREQ